MEIIIDNEAVQRAVAQAIINSAIGDVIAKRVTAFLQDYKFSMALDDALKEQIKEHVQKLLSADEIFKDTVRSKVEKRLTHEFIDGLMTKLFESAIRERF